MRILVVDDEPAVRDALERALRLAGWCRVLGSRCAQLGDRDLQRRSRADRRARAARDRTTAPISSVVALVALSATGHQRSTLVPRTTNEDSHEMDQFTGSGHPARSSTASRSRVFASIPALSRPRPSRAAQHRVDGRVAGDHGRPRRSNSRSARSSPSSQSAGGGCPACRAGVGGRQHPCHACEAPC
jgi:hypothetical protein